MQLLTTKFYPPPRRDRWVARVHVQQRLTSGIPGTVLVIAPLGFGKTSSVVAWLEQQATPFAWLSLDAADNEPMRFLLYVIAALQRLDPSIATDLQQLLSLGQLPASDIIATLLINSLATQPTPLILVLDDYHEITNETIHAIIQLLIERRPAQLSLILTTRHDPSFPLARWRVRGHITEVRVQELRFSFDEVRVVLQEYQLDDQQIAVLTEQTEGWIAGVQLAVLSLRDAVDPARFVLEFSGRHRHVIDYLLEEVLSQQSEAVQTFLIHTAHTERMCAPLCAAMLGAQGDTKTLTDAETLLNTLERSNLFVIPLDHQRYWFRYQRLFADFLRTRLPQAAQQTVVRRAAVWFAEQQLYDEAIHLLVRADDLPAAAQLIATVTQVTVRSGDIVRGQAWLALLPDELIRADRWLATVKAWNAIFTRNIVEAEQYAQAAETAQATKIDDQWLLVVQAWLAYYRNDAVQALALAEVGLRQHGERSMFRWIAGLARRQLGQLSAAISDLRAAQYDVLIANVPIGISDITDDLCDALNAFGQRHEALAICEQVLARLQDRHGQPQLIAAMTLCRVGVLHYEANQLEKAQHYLQIGLQYATILNHSNAIVIGQLYLALIDVQQQSVAVALSRLADLRHLVLQGFYTHYRMMIDALESWLRIRSGDRQAARMWLMQADTVQPHLALWRSYQDVRALLAVEEYAKADQRLTELEAHARHHGLQRELITVLLLRCCYHDTLANPVAALDVLKEAIDLAAPQTYLRAFYDEDPRVLDLLPQVRSSQARFVAALLGQSVPEGTSRAVLAEPLSEREHETLRLIALGLSNREIAQRMVVEVSTVKSHIKSAYAKLDVASRTQAILKARRLHLIDD
jgi:LuxR family maltose regulon positive regulatory protein